MRDVLAALLVAHVHAVRVAVAAPTMGDAMAVHSTLELIGVTTARRTRGCRGKKKVTEYKKVIIKIVITSLEENLDGDTFEQQIQRWLFQSHQLTVNHSAHCCSAK